MKRASYLAFGLSSGRLHENLFQIYTNRRLKKSLQISPSGKTRDEKGERRVVRGGGSRYSPHNYLYSYAQYGFLELLNAHTPRANNIGLKFLLEKKKKILLFICIFIRF